MGYDRLLDRHRLRKVLPEIPTGDLMGICWVVCMAFFYFSLVCVRGLKAGGDGLLREKKRRRRFWWPQLLDRSVRRFYFVFLGGDQNDDSW